MGDLDLAGYMTQKHSGKLKSLVRAREFGFRGSFGHRETRYTLPMSIVNRLIRILKAPKLLILTRP